MMPLKIKNLKFIIKYYALGLCLLTNLPSLYQEIIEESAKVEAPKPSVVDTIQRFKIDGVAILPTFSHSKISHLKLGEIIYKELTSK